MRAADLIYRAAIAWRGPAYWHWRYYGFDYRARLAGGEWHVRVLGRERRFATLGGWQPPGQVIHIVLSGPSVGRIAEPERLARAPTITVNGSYEALSALGGRPDLYVVSDVGFVRRQWDRFVEGVRVARALAFDHRVILEAARRDPALLDGRTVYAFDNLLRPYGRSARWWRRTADPRVRRHAGGAVFSVAPELGFFPSCTVAYIALQIAAAQRPRRIVFFGLDLGGGARFYGEAQPEKSMLEGDLQRCIVPHFTFAAAELKGLSIQVLNASPASALPDAVFPRLSPEAALAMAPDAAAPAA